MNLAIEAINTIRNEFYSKMILCVEEERNLTDQDLKPLIAIFYVLITYINSNFFSDEEVAILNRRLNELEDDMISYMRMHNVKIEGSDFGELLKNEKKEKQKKHSVPKDNKKDKNTLVLGKRLELD